MSLIKHATEKSKQFESQQAQTVLRQRMSSQGLKTPVYVLGANIDSLPWLPLLNVEAIIDDYLPAASKLQGNPVICMEDVPDGALVINCVTNSRPATAMRRLEEKTRADIYYGADLAEIFSANLPVYGFVSSTRESISTYPAQWESVYDALSDAQSKSTMEDIIAYRLSGDPRVLDAYAYRPQEQYFEDFLSLSKEVFVDGGAYDGETTRLFLAKYADCLRVHLFEPDPENFSCSIDRLSEMSQVVFHPVGLSDAPGELRFQVGDGSASVIAETGDMSIAVDTIDRLAPDATFIKLDLEGWELSALKGAERTIRENKPKLAIGAYHQPGDFLSIFRWVTQLRQDYKFSLRHYTESWTETVLYFY